MEHVSNQMFVHVRMVGVAQDAINVNCSAIIINYVHVCFQKPYVVVSVSMVVALAPIVALVDKGGLEIGVFPLYSYVWQYTVSPWMVWSA